MSVAAEMRVKIEALSFRSLPAQVPFVKPGWRQDIVPAQLPGERSNRDFLPP